MRKPLRTLIVDDEPAARRRLSLLCGDVSSVVVAGEAGDGLEALAFLADNPVDLLLLDIEMPGMGGMALAQAVCEQADAPAIVFVTAYAQFALAAFGVRAAGYLLKPVDPEALMKVLSRVAQAPIGPPSQTLDVFWAPHRGQLVRVSADDVEWIAGEGDYVRLHMGARSYLLSEQLSALEKQMDASRFLRVHRSAIVQLRKVVALRHTGAGAWALSLAGGQNIPVGRSYLSSVRAALGRV